MDILHDTCDQSINQSIKSELVRFEELRSKDHETFFSKSRPSSSHIILEKIIFFIFLEFIGNILLGLEAANWVFP
jgi:phosphate starvation-inducible membrane PsiE